MLASYLLRRLSHTILLLVATSILCFALQELAPGDFFEEARMNPQISSATIAALRAQYRLGAPLPVRYVAWLRSVVRGDAGFSLAYGLPVTRLIAPRIGNTLLLTISAMLLSWAICVPVGCFLAFHRTGWVNVVGTWATALTAGTPEIVLGSVLVLIFARTRWLPIAGMYSVHAEDARFWERQIDLSRHLILPLVVLITGTFPLLVRHVRSAVMGSLASSFVTAARSLGVTSPTLVLRYILPAAANPLIALLGLSFAGLLSGSLLVEVIFGWPGLGPLFLDAIFARDVHVVVGVVLSSGAFLLVGNLASDLILYACDPRIRVS